MGYEGESIVLSSVEILIPWTAKSDGYEARNGVITGVVVVERGRSEIRFLFRDE